MSKWVWLFPASVPWALFDAPLAPNPFFHTKKLSKVGPKCNQAVKTIPKNDPEGTETSNKISNSHIWDTGPADCANRLQSARHLLAGEVGRPRSTAQFVLDFDSLKSPGSSAQSAFTLHDVDPFSCFRFNHFLELGKSQQKIHRPLLARGTKAA